ncbi:hypothetical protein XELAEV_18008859mg [Xenopus laevis]|uniref:Uncharacterized protein n=1 Tax=Xenopus laevis TaxID=8355 RepID=A0A974I013_XENLA|nr:hypothetical protein XELAEV_18008859mg [Xenopus laevis]
MWSTLQVFTRSRSLSSCSPHVYRFSCIKVTPVVSSYVNLSTGISPYVPNNLAMPLQWNSIYPEVPLGWNIAVLKLTLLHTLIACHCNCYTVTHCKPCSLGPFP